MTAARVSRSFSVTVLMNCSPVSQTLSIERGTSPTPMPAAAQQESFRAVLGEALEEDCCLQVVQAVHDQLCGLMEDHKESRDPEPLTIGKGEVRQALAANGVSQAHIQTFEQQYDEAFGADAQLSPRNLVDPKKIEVKTADVTIKVSPDRGDLIETRILNGVKYILVRVEELDHESAVYITS